jgi:AraC-like DNA-binding protein
LPYHSGMNRRAVPTQTAESLLGPAAALMALFDCVEGVHFWVKDCEGRYRAMNRAGLLDYSLASLAEAEGKTDFDLSPAHIATQFRLDDERVLKGAKIVNRVELVGRFDHTAVWCVTDKVPLRDARGRIVGTAGVARPLAKDAVLPATADAAMARAVAFLRTHLAEPLDNATLARHVGLSVRVLERRFRDAFQLAPQQYLRRLRVRLACHPLVYSELILAEIAMAHGFCDQSHFGREFRRETGMTPREYRDRFRPRSGD